jgi:hypothetical protein
MTFFKDWVLLVLIHFTIDVVMIYFCYYYFVETPQFCLDKKKYEELNEVITKIAIVNGTYETQVKARLDNIEKLQKSLSIYNRKIITNTSPNSPIKNPRKFTQDSMLSEMTNLSLGYGEGNSVNKRSLIYELFLPYMKIFYKRKQLLNLIKLSLPFITVNFVYYGQLMFIDRLPGDAKFNSFLIFTSELFAPNLAGYLLQFTGRIKILCFFHVSSIIFSLLLSMASNPWTISVLLFFNSFSIALNFVVSYVYAAEVFPTSIKSSANGVLILIGNFSLVVGDVLMDLLPSPFYLFALFSLGSIGSLITMKETKTEHS